MKQLTVPSPSDVIFSKNFNSVFVASLKDNTISQINLFNGKEIVKIGKKYEINENETFSQEDSIDGELNDCKFTQPYGLALSNDHDYVFVADTDQNALRIL